MTRSYVSPWVLSGLYLFAFVLMASPIMDLTTTVWPLRPGDMPWRYGFLGLLPGYLHTPLLGLILAMAVAYWQGHSLVWRGTGILSLVAAVVLLVAAATFALDVVQMRALRAEEVRAEILLGGVFQEIKYLVSCAVLSFFGLGAGGMSEDVAARGRRSDARAS